MQTTEASITTFRAPGAPTHLASIDYTVIGGVLAPSLWDVPLSYSIPDDESYKAPSQAYHRRCAADIARGHGLRIVGEPIALPDGNGWRWVASPVTPA